MSLLLPFCCIVSAVVDVADLLTITAMRTQRR